MDHLDRQIQFAAFHVRWSPSDAAFIAESSQFPGLTYTDEWSSLAAIDGLIDLIQGSAVAA